MSSIDRAQDAYWKLKDEVRKQNKDAKNLVQTIQNPELIQQLGNRIKTVKSEYHVYASGINSKKTHTIRVTGQNFGTSLNKEQALIFASLLIKAALEG